jgi:ATP-dependent Clp protease ATP-binding subunit ClpA
MADRFDEAARRVLKAAWDEATSLGENAVGTEHLLIALAGSDPTTAGLLAASGVTTTDLRRAFLEDRPPRPIPDHGTLLSTLGVDLAEIRHHAEHTFGADAIARAAARTRTPLPRRPLRTYISCSRPLPPRRAESPLAGRRLEPIPRVTRLLKRTARAARPQPASPAHLLLAILDGNEPACELLAERDVNLDTLARNARRSLTEQADTRRTCL